MSKGLTCQGIRFIKCGSKVQKDNQKKQTSVQDMKEHFKDQLFINRLAHLEKQ